MIILLAPAIFLQAQGQANKQSPVTKQTVGKKLTRGGYKEVRRSSQPTVRNLRKETRAARKEARKIKIVSRRNAKAIERDFASNRD